MTDRKKTILYVVCSYGFFWVAIGLIGVVIMLMGDGAEVFQEGNIFPFLPAIAAWTPTLALFVLFKKLYPNISIKEFYKNAFHQRLNIGLLLCVTITQLGVFFGGVGLIAGFQGLSFESLLGISLPTLVSGFLWSLLGGGATGEQSGWRGFLQPHMEKKYSVIKASVIVGLIWGFWHAPLWFMWGYSGLDLVWVILGYMVSITMAAIIIGICYNRCKNLFVPIWIHFMFNFVLTMYTGELLAIIATMAILYTVVTVGYIVWHKHSSISGP